MVCQHDTNRVTGLITRHLDLWSSAQQKKSASGRGSGKKIDLYGIKKLRELILELAVRGKLVPQNPADEPAAVLLQRIAEEKARLVAEKKIKKQKPLPPITDEEKPFELPEGWQWTRLGIITNYGSSEKAEPDDVDGNTWVLELEDVEKITSKLLKKVRFSDRAFKSSKNRFESGDVIYGKLRPYLDKVLIADEAGVCTTEMIPVRAYSSVSPPFLRLLMKSPYFIDYANESTHGMNLPRMGTDKARLALVPMVPEEEQHRIVAKVDELMALCDQLEQQSEASISAHATLVETLLTTLTNSTDATELEQNWQRIAAHFDTLFTTEHSIDQLKQTVLQLAVMGKLVPQDPTDEPASVLLQKIINKKAQLVKNSIIKKSRSTDSVISDNCSWLLPDSWSQAELQDIFKFIDYRGKNPVKAESGKRIITAKNIGMGYIRNDPVEYISQDVYKSWMVRGFPKVGDILFVTEGHTMGFVARIDMDYEFALAQRTICLQPISGFDTSYALYALMSYQFQNIVIDNQTGSAAGGVKASKLKQFPIPIPPLAEQHRIVAKVDQLMSLCDQLKARIQSAQQTQLHLADALVDQAVS